jgi:aldehyde:ferredoxin oxidoreductase
MEAFGYAGRILRADLSSRRVDDLPTSDYADRFLGGRGIATRRPIRGNHPHKSAKLE